MQTRTPGGGRKPKAIETHLLNGNPSKIQLPEPIPVPKDRPPVPTHFDEISAAYWHSFCERIESMGVLTSFDSESLEMLVDSWRGYREMQAHVMKDGYVYAGELPKMTLSQYFRARSKLMEEVKGLLIQFGFTPIARAQLARANMKPEEADNDPLVAMLRARAERN